MSGVLDVSSDSSDTIILSSEETFAKEHKYEEDADVEDLVKKYIKENSLQTNPGCSSTEGKIDNENLDVPPIKRLRKLNEEKLYNASSFSSSSQNESEDEVEALQMLQEKYNKQNVVNKANEDIKENKDPVSNTNLKRLEKEILKQKRIEEREQKKREAAQEKGLKQALAAARKNSKPTECMKFITVGIDNDITNEEYSSEIITALQSADVRYTIQSQLFPRTITWLRKVESHSIDDKGKLVLTSEEQEAEEVLLVMNCKELIEHINNKYLCAYIQSLKSVLINKKIMLAIYGLQSYYRYLKNQKKTEMRAQITEEPEKSTSHRTFFKDFPKVTKKTIEYGLTELQLMCSCSHRLIDSGADLGLMVAQFSKAVAEIPHKLQRHEKFQQTDWFVAGDNRDCVKVDKHGNGLSRLWNQMLTTFPMARLETAEAISSKYPTASSLMQAYESCGSDKEAELLLQDIPVRRAAGPLSSSRKIGPELSKKIYNFFTSLEGDNLL